MTPLGKFKPTVRCEEVEEVESVERAGYGPCTMERHSCLTQHGATETADPIPTIEGRRFYAILSAFVQGLEAIPQLRLMRRNWSQKICPELWYGMSQCRDPIRSQHRGAENP